MNEDSMPILKKAYELYKTFHSYRKLIPKHDRYSVYERSENIILDLMECIFEAGYNKTTERLRCLEKASIKLNMLRLFIRLLKDTKSFDTKKYVILEEAIDEIGRMLGGWIRSIANGK